MQEITIFDVNGNSITDLVQWDKDVIIFVKENEIDKAYNVHFFNKNYEDTAMVVQSTYQDGKLSAVVPNDLLIDPYPITGYIYVEKNNEHKSIYCFRIVVRKRPKPANYIYSDQKEYITFEKVLEEAKGFSDNAKESYDKTKQSEENTKISEKAAKNSEEIAAQKADEAKTSAEQASQSELNANKSEENSLENAENSEKYALQSKSFAKGTGGIVRQNDDSDCAEYYYNQILQISQGIKGIIPMGTITFSDLELSENQHERFMFNISDAFVSDERFNDGGGISYGAGNNVIFTADGKWDVLASSDVSGVKGDKETYYHQGFVNITPENVGAVAIDGDISDTTATFEEQENRSNIETNEKLGIILGKIKKWFADLSNGGISTLLGENLVKSRALISNLEGKIAPSSITSIELEYLSGVNSNLQTQINALRESINNLGKTHNPVGAIIFTTVNENPSSYLGGIWESWGGGRVPVAVNPSDSNFDTVEKTGGASSITLTTSEIPSHNHSVGAHTHGLNNHTHGIPALSGSTGGNGSHSHTIPSLRQKSGALDGTGVINNYIFFNSGGGGGISTSNAENHTHSVTTNSSTTGVSSGTTANSATFNSGSTGSGNAHSNLQPYITCYMWKRIA